MEPPKPAQGATPQMIQAPIFSVAGVQAFATGNEVSLVFTRTRPGTIAVEGSAEPAQIGIGEPQAIISASPGTAKDLMTVLGDVIDAYEKEFGEIVTPFLKERAARQG
jgi:hypothetical protein